MAIKKTANTYHVTSTIEVLNNPENWDIYNLPNMIKEASVDKDSNIEGFDLKAEIKKYPEHLYVKIFAIKKDEINDNGDAFSEAELKKAAHTFIGVPLFTNHQNDDIEKARGTCIHSWYDNDMGGIYIIGKVDKVAYPKLARSIEENIVVGTSMGCILGHNRVLMGNGEYKSIYKVKKGDEVITHKGRVKKVKNLQIHEDKTNDLIYKIKVEGLPNEICATKEHPFNVLKEHDKCYITGDDINVPQAGRKYNKYKRRTKPGVYQKEEYKTALALGELDKYDFEWKNAENLKKWDMVSFPVSREIIENKEIGINEARLIGYFLAEGSYLKYKGNKTAVEFNFSIYEKDTLVKETVALLIKVFGDWGLEPKIQERKARHTCMVRLYGRKVASWFYKYCGEYSYNKRMSKDLLFLDPNIQKHIYATWTNGDGTRRRLYNANNDKYYDNIVTSTCSETLHYQMRFILSRLKIYSTTDYKYSNNMKKRKWRPSWNLVLGCKESQKINEVLCKDKMVEGEYKNSTFRITDDYLVMPIKRITKEYNSEPVYNIEVEDDNSYIVEGVVTHNCSVEGSLCSICHNFANTAEQYCTHVSNRKNRKFSGNIECQYHNSDADTEEKCPLCGSTKDKKIKLSHENTQIFEHNYGLKFIENSFVVNPACHECGISEILHIPNVNKKIAQLKESINKISENTKNKNFKTNNKLEKVAGQKEIDMLKDSMNGLEDVVKSMLQQKEQISMEYVSDLVKAMSDVQEVVDELVEMGYTQLPSPVTSESPISDITTSEQEPVPAPTQQIPTPTPPPNISTEELGGLGSVTKPKFSEKNKIKKEDFLKISSNLRNSINILKNLVHNNNKDKELKSMANENKDGNKETKIAATPENQDIIQEKQLEKKNEKLHPRTEDTPISITESKEQIGGSKQIDDVTSESPQVRKGTYDTITEDQLRSTSLGDAVIQNKETPDVITENQWTDISRLVGAKVRDDYTEVIGEGQLKDMLSNNKFVGTYETTTEDQLKDIPMNGTNRWANAKYVKSLIKIATNVVVDAITKYRTSPEELKKVAILIDNDTNTKNKAAYLSILNALPYKKEDRDNISKNINYFKIASSLDPFDALVFSVANNAQHGIYAHDILDSVSHVLNNKTAMDQVEEKIKTNSSSNNTKIVSKTSAFNLAIKELDKPEDGLYQIKGTFEDLGIKITESNKEEIVNAINKYAQTAIDDANTITLKIVIQPESGTFESMHKDEDMLDEGECPFAPENLDLGEVIEGPIEDIVDIGNNKKEETSPCLLSQKRENIVKEAQMFGGEMGGQGGMSQGPGAGASLPTPPGAMNDMPMQSLNAEPGAEEMGAEMEEELEPLPPGTACPVCTSKDVDIVAGKGKCNNCASEFIYKVSIDVTRWANLTPADGEEKVEGIGEEVIGEGEGFELPEEESMPAMAAVTRLYPQALEKIASQNIKLGSVSPLTGNTNTYKMDKGEYICLDTATKYKVAYVIDKKDPNKIYAQWSWIPKVANKSNCPSCQKSKNEFVKSLASVNMTETKFNELDISEKAKIILSMKKDGKLNKIANKNGSIIKDYKIAFSGYGNKFPIESCIEKLARRYGKNSIALSGPCEGSSLPECVCNNLKKAGVYTTGLAIKVADTWGSTCGSEECLEDQIRSGYSIREASTICESLKIALATEEDMFADELTNNNDIVEIDETTTNEIPLEDSIENVDPFENVDENTVTVELPANVVEEIGKAIDVAQGEETIGTEEIPVEEDAAAIGIEDTAGDVIGEGIEEIGVESPIEGEMKDMKQVEEVGQVEEQVEEINPEKEALKEEIKEEIKEELKEEKNNKGDLEDTGEEFKEGEGDLNPGNTGGESNEVNTENQEFGYSEASFMKSKMSKDGKINLDLEALANAIGYKKEASEKEIQHKNVQDVSEIGTYSAGENGSLIGHEKETIETATVPSVPRDKALIGNEDSDLNPQGKPQPKVPMAENGGTIGHENEQDLAVGNVEYTGGDQGAGKAETTASVEDELMHMKGFGSTKDSLERLANRMVEAAEKKLEAPQPVADDKDIQPIQDHKTIGNEEKFTAETPKNVETKGNGSMIGHEKETLGDKPDSPKDLPTIPVDNQLMGQETSEIGPEKQTKEKGTVIAKSNQESKVNNTKEAIRVAGRMLESKMITSDGLQTKIAELENYQPSQIRDLEKAMFSPKKGFGTVSEGISRPIIINETSNQRNSQDDLTTKLSSLFSLDKRNRLALENEDFNLKKSYGKI